MKPGGRGLSSAAPQERRNVPDPADGYGTITEGSVAMTTRSTKLMFIFLIAGILSACSAPGKHLDGASLPVDYEIEDVRNLAQDIGAYTASLPGEILAKTLQESLLSEFKRRYFAPWTGDGFTSNIAESVTTMKNHAEREWYGENKRKVPKKVLEELLATCDLEHFPSMNRLAIATAAADMRVLPTAKPFFETADDFPFDDMQNTGVKVNEPLRVLHASRDGLWVFVESADTNGWVESRYVGYIDKNQARKWTEQELIVIVKDASVIRDPRGFASQQANMGTLCPLTGDVGDAYEVLVATPAENHTARETRATVPKEEARKFPLKFGRESISLVGNELINKPYGWGEKFQDRDCSAMMRDFYLPFGIFLPRGSYNQIHSGRTISLAGLSSGDKERLIREKGVPFLTLVYLKGHIMLYVGTLNGKALVFHNIWGVNVKKANGGTMKLVIGKSIVSSLTPGSELQLVTGPLLERISTMLVVTDRRADDSH